MNNKSYFKINGKIIYEIIEPSQEFIDKWFKIDNIEFIVDKFEELILQDVFSNDKATTQKLKRDILNVFREWVDNKIKAKENMSINLKGKTRSGKSLIGLAITDMICERQGVEFDTEKIVCGNQKEFRQSLKNSQFGDVRQIDENAFANTDIGSTTEMQQLKDIQNIIAKRNITTLYITPRQFLPTGATIGFSTWGKDPNNWLNRVLVYNLESLSTNLLGHLVINTGKIFMKYGCYFFKPFGGCTNPSRNILIEKTKKDLIFKKVSDEENSKITKLPIDFLKYSSCIPKDFKMEDLDNSGQNCPFYNICKHPLNTYEKKKDKWIVKEMEGGTDERTKERFSVAIRLLQVLAFNDIDTGNLRLKAKNKAEIKLKVRLYIGKISATKFTSTEFGEILDTMVSFTNIEFFTEACEQLELNSDEELKKVGNTTIEDLENEFKKKIEDEKII